jgi:hypothetical protein
MRVSLTCCRHDAPVFSGNRKISDESGSANVHKRIFSVQSVNVYEFISIIAEEQIALTGESRPASCFSTYLLREFGFSSMIYDASAKFGRRPKRALRTIGEPSDSHAPRFSHRSLFAPSLR